MKLGYRGNLQAMLVLQIIQKNTPKTDGGVISKLVIAQSASVHYLKELWGVEGEGRERINGTKKR